MSFRVLLRPEAETEIGDAATWYEEQKAGLGNEFVDAVFHAVDGLSANPPAHLPSSSPSEYPVGFSKPVPLPNHL